MIQKRIFNLLFVGSFLISTISCRQKATSYIINPTINKTVAENIKSTFIPSASSIKFTQTINDSTQPENYGLRENFPTLTQASLSHDSIFITSLVMARKASFGYKIILNSDYCTIKYFSLADEDIFKISKTDKPSHLISFVCKKYKLTFSQKPQFKIGEIMEGIIELTTDDFWSFIDGQNTKVKVQLTGYFKTTLSEFRPNEKDVFKEIQ